MALYDAKKYIDKTILKNDEEALVTISFKASADLINKPSDILLLFDRSNSMKGEKFEFVKQGAMDFIDHIVKASGGTNNFENNTFMGLITFGFDATIDSNLTTDANKIKNLINNIIIPEYSKTNHAAAFKLATTIFKDNYNKDQVLVIFTDGDTTFGEEPNTYVNKLKKMGVEIYCIGIDVKVSILRYWSSDPKNIHCLTTRDNSKLVSMFNKISYEVSKAGAKDVIINEKINNYFEIVKINNTNFGNIELIDKQSFNWKIDIFGIDEEAKCTFIIKNISKENKEVNVNNNINYKDRDNNILTFPNPTVKLIYDKPCNDVIIYELDNQFIDNIGRILKIKLLLKKICPNKKVAVGLVLTELINNIEYKRGMKTILINPIKSNKCENILIRCINFVLPEELNKHSICNNRIFKVRTFINYLDTNI